MLFQIDQCLLGVPREHNSVYTLIRNQCKERCAPASMCEYRLRGDFAQPELIVRANIPQSP
jgi:hypothetical protein